MEQALEPPLSSRWRPVRLSDVLKLRKEVVHPRDKPKGRATFVGLEHIQPVTGTRNGSVEIEMSQLTGRKPRFFKGDIVYGYLRPYLNKVWLAEFDGLCSVDQYVYHVLPGEADAEFVAWFMRSPIYLESAPIHTTPGQLPRIRTEEVSSVELALPPLHEQRRIAAILREQMAAVERARAAAEAQTEAAEALSAAYLRAVFDGPEGRRWPTTRLAEVASVSGGIQKSPARMPRSFHRPFLTVRNVQRGRLNLDRIERFEITSAEFSRYRLQPGDLLIVEGNGSREHIGRNAIFRGEVEECVHQNHVIRVRPHPFKIESEFASRYLNSGAGQRQMFEKAMTTTGLYTLSVSKIEQLTIPVPTIEVQRDVVALQAEETAGAEALVGSLREQIDGINALPAALLRRAFSGEL